MRTYNEHRHAIVNARVTAILPGVAFVLIAQRVVLGSDYEDRRRVHSSEPSSACARPDRPRERENLSKDGRLSSNPAIASADSLLTLGA